MYGKPGFSAVKLGFLAKTLLFCYSMKTLLFFRKPVFSSENPGFLEKTQVFRQKNPAYRPLPFRLAIVTFAIPFLMMGKVTFDERVDVLESYCKGDISYTFIQPYWLSFQNSRSLKI